MISLEMLIMDGSRQRYSLRVFYFFGQGDLWRNDRIIGIDVVLLRGVVDPLLELSIVATLLKFIFL
jgi:hypothetical protein